MRYVIFFIILAAIGGGSNAPFAKVALGAFQPFTIVFMRFLIASLVLLPLIRKRREFNWRSMRLLLPVALVGSLNPILLFVAMQYTQASVAPLIYASVPLMTALYLHFFRGRKIAAGKVLGIMVGFAGVAIIILLPFLQQGEMDFRRFAGNLLILGAAVAFMIYGILSSDKQQRLQISPLALTYSFAVVTLLLCIPFAVFELIRWPLDATTIRASHILATFGTGLLGTAIFYMAYQKAIQLGSEVTASLFTYLQPIATIIFAVILVGEAITLPFAIGGTLAVIGAGMATNDTERQAL